VSMTFSFDFLNALNNVYFNDPVLNLTNRAAFGTISTQNNDPRRIQFGLRVDF
ncbi:MAG: hypothetical protein HY646_14930, partial [Acidobacteria bacterium]|nr:hypothetical protein [Acidobacteriota bacterium]